MKSGLCRKLAIENVRKNYRFFIPRILTETGLLACFYIIFTLACDSRLERVKGGSYLPTFMLIGVAVISILSVILMLYTNSFLMKQRKREFGLYNVLGMEKKHVCRVLFHESLVCCLVSVAAGLLLGIVFYKLASLAICKLLKAEILIGFYFITPKTIVPSGLIFVAIDAVTYLVNCISIGRMKPVEMINAVSAGEKEPKTKWVLLILGVLTLGGGYYIAVTTKNPLEALLLFFVAVLLVMAGTYLLFTAGSVFVLKALKKNEKFYYRPGRFTAVSGLLYRMKQNAVGLASVALLATGVLVMISSTFCLYSRTEGVITTNYPDDFYYPTEYYHMADSEIIPDDVIAGAVKDAAERAGLEIKRESSEKFLQVSFSHKPGAFVTNRPFIDVEDTAGLSDLCTVTFITEETFINLGGDPLGLEKGEVAVCSYNMRKKFGDEKFTLCESEYRVAKELTFFPIKMDVVLGYAFGIVVADDEVLDVILADQKEAYRESASAMQYRYAVSFTDRDAAAEKGDAFAADVDAVIEAYIGSQGFESFGMSGYDAFWDTREELYGMYGSLLFLGILLGLVCLFATVLIIYYKQISEGYDDRQRYQIMRKIGMTEEEVKKTVRIQSMLVFFLPLVTAGIHVAFAFPILTKLMSVLFMNNAASFVKWCVIVYAAFAVVYVLIYKLTAKTYYKIVY